MNRAVPAIAAALTVLATTTACGGDDTVSASPATSAGAAACSKAAQHWPKTVSGQKSRKVATDSKTVAAWGDPAIIARCGVTSPGPTSSGCLVADGIDWVQTKLSDGYRFVTYGRSPAIEVLVPTKYGSWPLAAFSSAAKQTPQGTHRCVGNAAT